MNENLIDNIQSDIKRRMEQAETLRRQRSKELTQQHQKRDQVKQELINKLQVSRINSELNIPQSNKDDPIKN